MSKRLTATLSNEEYEFVINLAKLERRSKSETIAAIVARSMPELRKEWHSQGELPSLSRQKRRVKHDDIEGMLLNP